MHWKYAGENFSKNAKNLEQLLDLGMLERKGICGWAENKGRNRWEGANVISTIV